jgi:hypothetical protein
VRGNTGEATEAAQMAAAAKTLGAGDAADISAYLAGRGRR